MSKSSKLTQDTKTDQLVIMDNNGFEDLTNTTSHMFDKLGEHYENGQGMPLSVLNLFLWKL